MQNNRDTDGFVVDDKGEGMSDEDRAKLEQVGPLPAPVSQTAKLKFMQKAVYQLVHIPFPEEVGEIRQMEAPLGFKLHSFEVIEYKSVRKDGARRYVLCIFEAIMMVQQREDGEEGPNLPPLDGGLMGSASKLTRN